MSDERKGNAKIIGVIGQVLFWGVWAYGIISLVIASGYSEALKAGYTLVIGG